jgi:hypothetical protein
MIALSSLPVSGTARQPTSAVGSSRQVKGVHATVIVRTLLAQALQAKWVAPEEGVAVMRWLDRLDRPVGDR